MPVVSFIPAVEQINPDTGKKQKKRVAAYIRVSSLSDEQEGSLDAQREHFQTIASEHPDWEMTKIYQDHGISGMLTDKRAGFQEMLCDAKHHCFDTLLVKSISRFARNTVTTISTIRQLNSYGINCYFEKENLDSAQPQTEFILTIMAAMAQSESISLSGNVRLGLEYRMKRGEWSLAFSKFLGYDKNEKGEVVINEEQAATVREIYTRFLAGESLENIARQFTAEGRVTGSGSTVWGKKGVSRIICNAKYTGRVVLQNTYTADVLTKTRKINKGELPQYIIDDGIPPIVDRQTWLLAQGELARRARILKKEPAPGQKPRWGNNDFTRLIICPKCGAFMNRHLARQTRIWKCHNRAIGSGCRSEILKEKEVEKAALTAAQMLYDKHPTIRHGIVPTLTMESDVEELIEAAAIYTDNMLSDRIIAFLDGEYPEVYDTSIPRLLLERVEFSDTEWTFRFWGKQTIKVPRQAAPQKENGRRLKRS